MFKCIKNALIRPRTEGPSVLSGSRFAFIVGHNESSQGAKTFPLDDSIIGGKGKLRQLSEWEVNRYVARRAKELLWNRYGSKCHIIFRPTGSYSRQVDHVQKECVKFDIEKAISLHLNSFPERATGLEGLVLDDINGSYHVNLMDFIGRGMSKAFGVRKRRENGLFYIKSGHGGYQILEALYDRGVDAMILEPVFCNHKTPEAERFFAGLNQYAKVLAAAAHKSIRGDLD